MRQNEEVKEATTTTGRTQSGIVYSPELVKKQVTLNPEPKSVNGIETNEEDIVFISFWSDTEAFFIHLRNILQ